MGGRKTLRDVNKQMKVLSSIASNINITLNFLIERINYNSTTVFTSVRMLLWQSASVSFGRWSQIKFEAKMIWLMILILLRVFTFCGSKMAFYCVII